MVLSTHAVIGGATAIFLRQNPILAFIAGFVSHFIFDAIPHWHYPFPSLRHRSSDPMENFFIYDASFAKDVLKTGMDFGIGLIVILLSLREAPEYIPITMIGAVAAVLPDALQLAYYRFPNSSLKYLQRFHHTIHAKSRLDSRPLLGIGSQAILIAICAAILFSRA